MKFALIALSAILLAGCTAREMSDAEVLERAKKIDASRKNAPRIVPFPRDRNYNYVGQAYNEDGCLFDVYRFSGIYTTSTQIPVPVVRSQNSPNDESSSYQPCFKSKATR